MRFALTYLYMPRDIDFIRNVALRIGDNVTNNYSLKEGQFFDGGDVMVSVRKFSRDECNLYGLDSTTQARQLYVEGKFFSDGREYNFILMDDGVKWEVRQLEVGKAGSWEESTYTFARFPSSEEIYDAIALFLDRVKNNDI